MEMIQILAKLNAQEPALFLKPRQPYRINQPSDFKLPRSMLQELTGMLQHVLKAKDRHLQPLPGLRQVEEVMLCCIVHESARPERNSLENERARPFQNELQYWRARRRNGIFTNSVQGGLQKKLSTTLDLANVVLLRDVCF